MTLKEIVDILEQVALQQPGIKSIVPNDIYELNSSRDTKYGVFGWTQMPHRSNITSGSNYFSFNLFYVDRLNSENTNRLQIQSTGIEILKNIIRTAIEEMDLGIYGDVNFVTFTQRFVDDCAGVYAKITFVTEDDNICEED